jgi:DNA-binding NarL/FixJ family response regulator
MTDEGPTILCLGRCPRASRRRCAFCANTSSVICDGERCIRPICDDHRWTIDGPLRPNSICARCAKANSTRSRRSRNRSAYSGETLGRRRRGRACFRAYLSVVAANRASLVQFVLSSRFVVPTSARYAGASSPDVVWPCVTRYLYRLGKRSQLLRSPLLPRLLYYASIPRRFVPDAPFGVKVVKYNMLALDIVPLKTFVIERQALITKALHSFLNENPMIRVVGDAPSARLEDLQRTRPDLNVFGLDNALLDVSEALALVRSVCPDVRFCVLSTFANSDVMQRSIASGADGFVVKDISPSELDVAFRLLASGRKEALVSTKASGAVAKLTEKQTQWLAKTLSSKNPAQMQFPIALWTREIIREPIKRRFGVNMALTGVGNLMRRLGFSVQRPLMRAYERNPEAVKHWLEVGCPDIQKMAKKHHAMIFFEDESGIRSDYRSGTT